MKNRLLALVFLAIMMFVSFAFSEGFYFQYGAPGDLPVTGDWDGNGSKTVGVYRPSNSTFYLNNALYGPYAHLMIQCGPPSCANCEPFVQDWNQDGVDDVGMFNPDNQLWYICIHHEIPTP